MVTLNNENEISAYYEFSQLTRVGAKPRQTELLSIP